MKFSTVALALARALSASVQADTSSWPQYASMEMKILVVVKSVCTAQCATNNCAGTLNDTQIDWIGSAFLNTFPQMVSNMTSGVVRFNTELVISPTPLTSFSAGSDISTDPSVMEDDVSLFNITVANYDHIITIGPWTEWGYWTAGSEVDGLGWTSVNILNHNMSTPDDCAGYLHETLHANNFWYDQPARLGLGNTPDGGSDDLATLGSVPEFNYTATSGGDAGYAVIGAPFTAWNKLYMDWMNGEICKQDDAEAGTCNPNNSTRSGLGPKAWQYPTRRENYHGLSAGYLASHSTWPGEPATKSTYSGPSYTGYVAPRNWQYVDALEIYPNRVSGSSGATGTPGSGVSSGATSTPTPTPSPGSSPVYSPAPSSTSTSSYSSYAASSTLSTVASTSSAASPSSGQDGGNGGYGAGGWGHQHYHTDSH